MLPPGYADLLRGLENLSPERELAQRGTPTPEPEGAPVPSGRDEEAAFQQWVDWARQVHPEAGDGTPPAPLSWEHALDMVRDRLQARVADLPRFEPAVELRRAWEDVLARQRIAAAIEGTEQLLLR